MQRASKSNLATSEYGSCSLYGPNSFLNHWAAAETCDLIEHHRGHCASTVSVIRASEY